MARSYLSVNPSLSLDDNSRRTSMIRDAYEYLRNLLRTINERFFQCNARRCKALLVILLHLNGSYQSHWSYETQGITRHCDERYKERGTEMREYYSD